MKYAENRGGRFAVGLGFEPPSHLAVCETHPKQQYVIGDR
jgi:hypothetical protein